MIYHSDECLAHTPTQEFAGRGLRSYPEQADRVKNIVTALSTRSISPVSPQPFDVEWVKRIHSPDYVEFIQSIPQDFPETAPTSFNISGKLQANSSIYAKLGHYFFDPATPIMGGTPRAAFGAVDCALSMADTLTSSPLSAALCRPPGHHAMSDCGGGYCIFNNVAIAAEYLRTKGKSVSILDLDYHHGNGTQSIFYDRDDVQYVSIHADTTSNYPFYWGFSDQTGEDLGKGYTHNLPVSNTISESDYLSSLDKAISIVTDFSPDIVLVSMGFDCYIQDPIAGLSLDVSSYTAIGEKLQCFDHLGIILEGGYAIDAIGECFVNLYTALEN